MIERPDGLTKSFAYPGSMLDGFAEALRVGRHFLLTTHDGGLYVTTARR